MNQNFLDPKLMKKMSKSSDKEVKENLKLLISKFAKRMPQNASKTPISVDYYSMNDLPEGTIFYHQIYSSQTSTILNRPLVVFRNDSTTEYPGEFEVIDAIPLLSFYSHTNGGKTMLDDEIYLDVLVKYYQLYVKLMKDKSYKKMNLIAVKKIKLGRDDFPLQPVKKLDKANWERLFKAIQTLNRNKEISLAYNDEWTLVKPK